jgi:hypothetical protein
VAVRRETRTFGKWGLQVSQNFVDRWVDYASDRTEAPEIFHRYMAYMAVSVSLGERAWFPWNSGKLFPNIYMLFLAESAAYKSTAINMIRDVINEVDDEIEVPNDFTSASLSRILVKYRRGFIPVDEFSIILKASEGHFSTVKNILTSVYDTPRRYRLPYRKEDEEGDKNVLRYPVFSITAATTPETFVKDASLEDLKGGFLSRFIIIPGDDTDKCISTPPGADDYEIRRFAGSLKRLRDEAFWDSSQPLELSNEAWQMRDRWYREIWELMKTNHQYKEFSNSVNRARTYAIKFSMLQSVIEGHDHVIEAEDMEVGIKMADSAIRSLFSSMGNLEVASSNDKWVQFLAKARSVLKNHPEDNPTSRTKLYKTIRHIKKQEMDQVLGTLQDRKEISIEVGPNGQQTIHWIT